MRYQARVARYRRQRTRHLYEMSKALAVGRSEHDIAATSERFIASRRFRRAANFITLMLTVSCGYTLTYTSKGMTPWDDAIARWSFDKGQPAGAKPIPSQACLIKILPLAR